MQGESELQSGRWGGRRVERRSPGEGDGGDEGAVEGLGAEREHAESESARGFVLEGCPEEISAAEGYLRGRADGVHGLKCCGGRLDVVRISITLNLLPPT